MGLQVTDVQRSLAGFDYPGTAADLANHAEKHGADSKLVDALRGLEKDTFSGQCGHGGIGIANVLGGKS